VQPRGSRHLIGDKAQEQYLLALGNFAMKIGQRGRK